MFGNVGQPNIVGWSTGDNILRFYTYNPLTNKFVATSQATVFIDMSRYITASPKLSYLASGSALFFAFNTTSGVLAQAIYSSGTSQTANPNFTTTNPHVYAISQKSNCLIVLNNITTNNDAILRTNGTLSFLNGQILPYLYPNVLLAEFHPNEECIFAASATGGTVFINSGTFDTGFGLVPTFNTAGVAVALSGTPTFCKWSPNGVYLFVGYSSGRVDTFQWDSTAKTLTLAASYNTNLGSITAIDVRFDSRFIAIGGLSGGVYTASIYPRIGPLLQSPIRTITPMGKFLNFTGDGSMLIDTASSKCYAFSNASNNFTDNSSVMSNIATTFLIQAVNNYIPDNTLSGYIYDVALNDIVAGNLSTMSLKLMLLNASAVYNKSDISMNAVTNSGAYQVSGNGWPANGVAITGVTTAINADGFSSIQANLIEQAVDNTFSYRNAVIYDSTSNKPIIFLDFGALQQTQQQTSLTFDLSTAGIVQFRT